MNKKYRLKVAEGLEEIEREDEDENENQMVKKVVSFVFKNDIKKDKESELKKQEIKIEEERKSFEMPSGITNSPKSKHIDRKNIK